MKEKYTFNGEMFASKKAVDDYIRKIKNKLIKSQVGIMREDHEMFSFFKEIVMVHNEKDEKIGSGIDYFYFIVDTYGNDQLRIRQIDGNDIDCSYIYSRITKARRNTDEFLNMALRNAIRDQIVAFRRGVETLQCVQCGDGRNCDIDHIKPFSVIRNDFLKTVTKPEIPIDFYDDEENTCSSFFKMNDEDFERKWTEYHRLNATYQVLCRNCNLKKGKKY